MAVHQNRRLWMAAALLLAITACTDRGSAPRYVPPPPPCNPDGVYRVPAQRTNASGSVCNLNDLRQLQGDISIRRTGSHSVQIEHKGRYRHDAQLDPYRCVVSTTRSPSYGRTVLGTKVSGTVAYQITVQPNGALSGPIQLDVTSNNILVGGCRASFNVFGHRTQ